MIVQGITSGKIAVPLLVDASGRVIITSEQPTTLRPTDKNTSFTNLNLPAGSSVQVVVTVTASQIWRATMFMHRYTGTVAGVNMTSRLDRGGTIMPFLFSNALVSANPVVQALNMLLQGGDIISTSINGATLNDDYQGVLFAERIE